MINEMTEMKCNHCDEILDFASIMDNGIKDIEKLGNVWTINKPVKQKHLINSIVSAMDASDKEFGELPSILKGNTSVMYSETGNAPAKVIKAFRKKSEKPLLKGAFIEEAIYLGDDQLDMFVDIKSREELIGEIIGLLQSPAKNVVSALQSSGGKLSGILKTLSQKEG